jgi:hypothetical protein
MLNWKGTGLIWHLQGGIRKTRKKTCQDSGCPWQDFNWTPKKYRSTPLLLHQPPVTETHMSDIKIFKQKLECVNIHMCMHAHAISKQMSVQNKNVQNTKCNSLFAEWTISLHINPLQKISHVFKQKIHHKITC